MQTKAKVSMNIHPGRVSSVHYYRAGSYYFKDIGLCLNKVDRMPYTHTLCNQKSVEIVKYAKDIMIEHI